MWIWKELKWENKKYDLKKKQFGHFTKYIQLTNKHMKRHSTSVVISGK